MHNTRWALVHKTSKKLKVSQDTNYGIKKKIYIGIYIL